MPAHHPCLQINYGGDVPQHYYLRNHVRVQYDHQATVGRGSSLQVDNEILFPGCVLRWAQRPPTHTWVWSAGAQSPGRWRSVTRDEALFHCTKPRGVPRGLSQIHSIPDFSEAP